MKIDIKETKKVTKVEETKIGEKVLCDSCKAELVNTTKYINKSYYHVVTGHNDWGNDSCDSVECHDYCCDCICKVFERYVKESKTGCNSMYFEVEHQ